MDETEYPPLLKKYILQLGDIHLPLALDEQTNIDQKDQSFSTDLANIISSKPTKVVFKQVHSMLVNQNIDAILFMGDFTEKGSIDGFRSTAKYVAESLQIGSDRKHAKTQVGIVPGNHDINRDLAKKPDFKQKFKPLNLALTNVGLPTMVVKNPKYIKLDDFVHIELLNSCWGCGAVEYIPSDFRDIIANAIDDALKSGAESALDTYYNRQFDTPAFSEDAIQSLAQTCTELPADSLLVAVAHHNLLPQSTPRIDPYTELVNSGRIRTSLVETSRPVIYLHGHIHDDPIEIINGPLGDQLVCISAPAVADGFNLIEVIYTGTNRPLVCNVKKWRFDRSKVLKEIDTVAIPLIGKRRRATDSSLGEILAFILQKKQCYWQDLAKHQPEFYEENANLKIREAIELLRSDQTVIVDNYDSDPSSWLIRATI